MSNFFNLFFITILFIIPFSVFSSGENTYSGDLESGSSQYYSASDSVSLSQTGDLTIQFWYKFESDIFTAFVNKWTTNVSWAFFYNSNTLNFYNSSNGSNNFGSSVSWTPTVGVWYHIALVYTASAGSAKYYVNGSQVGTTQTGHYTSTADTSSVVTIGQLNTGDGRFADGLFDDIRLYSVARSLVDLTSDEDCQITSYTNVVAYWKLNNDLLDSSGNSNGLTAYNSPTSSTSVPFLDDCSGGGGGGGSPATSTYATSTLIQDQGNITFGIAIIIFFMTMIFTGFITNGVKV